MTKLSNAMFEHLLALAKVAERGAYPGLSMGTLFALERRGLVSVSYPIGSSAYPRVATRWSITDAGRAEIAERSK